jgi:hypothetical protein
MAEQKFTPGPWFREASGTRGSIRLATICYGRNHYGDGPAGTVCHIEGAMEGDERLIITSREVYDAARDLLYALDKGFFDYKPDQPESAFVANLRSALAKARGED